MPEYTIVHLMTCLTMAGQSSDCSVRACISVIWLITCPTMQLCEFLFSLDFKDLILSFGVGVKFSVNFWGEANFFKNVFTTSAISWVKKDCPLKSKWNEFQLIIILISCDLFNISLILSIKKRTIKLFLVLVVFICLNCLFPHHLFLLKANGEAKWMETYYMYTMKIWLLK